MSDRSLNLYAPPSMKFGYFSCSSVVLAILVCLLVTSVPLVCAEEGGSVLDRSIGESNELAPQKTSRLHWAIERGDLELVKLLISNGEDIESTLHPLNYSPIVLAALQGRLDLVDYFLSIGAKQLNLEADTTALIAAATEDENLEIVKRLLRADPDLVDYSTRNGLTALNVSALFGATEIVRALLSAGANPHVTTDFGGNALSSAAYGGYSEIYYLLKNEGVSTNLEFAVAIGDIAEVNSLLRQGEDPNSKDKTERPMIVIGAVKGQTEAVELLVKYGARVNESAPDGTTALWWAAGAGNVGLVSYLLSVGADVNKATTSGLTPLMMAANSRTPEVVGILLKNGASVSQKGREGSMGTVTAFSFAQKHGDQETLKLLTEAAKKDKSTRQTKLTDSTAALEAVTKQQPESTALDMFFGLLGIVIAIGAVITLLGWMFGVVGALLMEYLLFVRKLGWLSILMFIVFPPTFLLFLVSLAVVHLLTKSQPTTATVAGSVVVEPVDESTAQGK